MAEELITAVTVVSLGATAVLVGVAWIITHALCKAYRLSRPQLDYWIILWLTWDVLIHFILVRAHQ